MNREVKQYTLDGNYSKTYKSVTEASKSIDMPISAIYLSINRGTLCNGYHFKYSKEQTNESGKPVHT